MPGTVISIGCEVGEKVRGGIIQSKIRFIGKCSLKILILFSNSFIVVPDILLQVFEGQEVAVIEAMKLQNSLVMGKTGIVSEPIVYLTKRCNSCVGVCFTST